MHYINKMYNIYDKDHLSNLYHSPSKMTKVGINRSTNNLAVDFPELLSCITEGNDLSRAHKGEVQWVEK